MLSGEMTSSSSMNGDGKTGYSHLKELNETPILYHSQKVTQMG